MRVESFLRKAPSKNVSEDAILLNEKINVYGVFDGATPLTPFQDEQGMNGAYLASNIFKDYFTTHYPENLPLVEGVAAANRLLKAHMEKYGINQEKVEHLWSTCAAIIKFEKDGMISFAQLGDCMIIAEYQNGLIKVLTRDTVKNINYRARVWREELRKQGVHIPDEEYFQDRKKQLYFNRTLANKPFGYSVANGTEEVGDNIQHGQVRGSELKAILLLSDGLFHPDFSLDETFKKIRNANVSAYAIELERHEMKNRLRSDDKAGIMITL
ncbi:protein phosphatase 2C domain-containing protein [Neobacillus sp. NPDC058068]|uniref:protein phosphatase 2C domain-containing protein n=1 Tax=Neobacillus sp. NPDC058068 TaxID=3346325 RepID=UPI0036DAF8D8